MSGTSGTIRTDTFLLSSEFQDGQSPGSISPQDARDLIVSKPSVLDIYDDSSNASGLGAPAILYGTVYGHKASGLTVGSGMSTPVRTANATALQNAITYASANKKFFELIPGTYEIYSSVGLTIPYSAGFVWRGSIQSQIYQYYATNPGAPVLSIGDCTDGINLLDKLDFEGVFLGYGASQTGFTLSNTLQVGTIAWSKIGVISVGGFGSPSPVNPGWRGVFFPGNTYNPSNACYFFSNRIYDWRINGAQLNIMDVASGGTGWTAENIYINGGGGSENFPAISGWALVMDTTTTEVNFNQLNIEWLTAGTLGGVMNFQNQRGLRIEHLHQEGGRVTGANPYLIGSSNNVLDIDQWTIEDIYFSTTYMSGTGNLVAEYMPSSSTIKVRNVSIKTNFTGEVNAPVQVFQPSNIPSDSTSTFQIEGWNLVDSAGGNWFNGTISIDEHTPASSTRFMIPYNFVRYTWGFGFSIIEGANINISSTYTHYGQYQDATLYVPASITSFTLTLADTMGASGTVKPRPGNSVHVRRQTGSASGTLTVVDGAGSTLTTSTTSNSDYLFYFNGTAWASTTAVS